MYGLEPNLDVAAEWRRREKELDDRDFRSHPDWFYKDPELR